MSYVYGFEPIAAPGATRLILGSMPGRASLIAGQYYAHPRNSFWRIVEATLGIETGLPYEQRCAQLERHRVAVWDVLRACFRASSLDSDIDESSIVPNHFAGFFASHRDIRTIYFNGTKALAMYEKHVLPGLSGWAAGIPMYRLPSTSPANASISFEAKVRSWRGALEVTVEPRVRS